MAESTDDEEGGAGGMRSRKAILEGSLRGTLLRLAWPMAASSMLGEVQNLISTFWIGQLVGTAGLATLAVLGPVIITLHLVTGAVHIGVQVLSARSAGGRDGKARQIITNGGYLGFAWGVTITLIGLWQLQPITQALAGKLDVAHGLHSFLLPWLVFYAVPVVSGVTMFAVSATGWTRFGLIQSIISIALLIVLMPIFVRGLHLDLAGIAFSDGCSDVLLLALTCGALYKFRSELGLGHWQRSDWRLDFGIWREILNVGLLYQVARGMDFVAQVVLVRVMMKSGDDATVAGYGVAMAVITLVVSVISCLGGAAGIMIGQNVGAGQSDRAKETLRVALAWILCAGGGVIVLALVSAPVFRIFTDDETVVEHAVATINVLKWAMPAAMASGLLLRAYTAVSPNRLGNSVSILCAVTSISIATWWPGTALERVGAAMITSQYLRLIVLGSLYRRSFTAVISRRI